MVDCAQLYYSDNASEDDGGRGNLRAGVRFFAKKDERTASFLKNFQDLFEAIETKGLFPRKESRGSWKQVYQYYDLIIEAATTG